jgi:hypothetical protein
MVDDAKGRRRRKGIFRLDPQFFAAAVLVASSPVTPVKFNTLIELEEFPLPRSTI